MMYLDRGLVGYDASVFYGFISFDARLFGSRHGDCGRTADGHNRISCYSRPAGKHATNVSDGVKANRTGSNDKCNNEADTHDRSMGAARSAAAFGQRDGFKNKGRRLYPPKAAYRECDFCICWRGKSARGVGQTNKSPTLGLATWAMSMIRPPITA